MSAEDQLLKRQKTTRTDFSVTKKLRLILKRNRPKKETKVQWENVSLNDIYVKLEELIHKSDPQQLQSFVEQIPMKYLNETFEIAQCELEYTLLMRMITNADNTSNKSRYHQLIVLLLNRNGIDLQIQDNLDNTLLHIACMGEWICLELIEMLILKGVNPNVFNRNNRTALDYLLVASSETGFGYTKLKAVKLLVRKYNAELNLESPNENANYPSGNCLHILNVRGSFCNDLLMEAIQFLVDSGANVNFANRTYGITPLMHACFESKGDSHLRYIELLIQNKADVRLVDKRNWTALHHLIAFWRNNLTIDKLLIDQTQADVDIQNDAGNTPLHMACDKQSVSVEIIEKLLRKGANPNIFNLQNCTPLDVLFNGCSFNETHLKAANLLVLNYNAELNIKSANVNMKFVNGNCLQLVSCRRAFNKLILIGIQFLIDKGANVNDRSEPNSATILMQACAKSTNDSHLKFIELLIQNNADVNLVDANRKTLLHYLVKNNPEIARLLVEKIRVDVNIQDKDGNAALHYLCSFNTPIVPSLFKLLLSNGANANLFNRANETPLYMLLRLSDFNDQNDMSVVELLVQCGAQLNVESKNVDNKFVNGNCLIQLCCRFSFDGSFLLKAIQFLIDNGAQVNFCNQTAVRTPLTQACIKSKNNSHLSYIELLIANKCDIHLKDINNHTALDCLYTSWDGNIQVAKLLITHGADCISTYRSCSPLKEVSDDMFELLLNAIVENNEQYPEKIYQILSRQPASIYVPKLIKSIKQYQVRMTEQNLIRSVISSNSTNALATLILTCL